MVGLLQSRPSLPRACLATSPGSGRRRRRANRQDIPNVKRLPRRSSPTASTATLSTNPTLEQKKSYFWRMRTCRRCDTMQEDLLVLPRAEERDYGDATCPCGGARTAGGVAGFGPCVPVLRRRRELKELLIVMVSAALLLMAATPAVAQSPVGIGGDAISPASQDQYGDPPVEEAARDAPGYAVAHAFTASEAFEEARAAAKSAGADDETASALAAQAAASRDEVSSESKSAGES
jgi:hypothetical protein